MESIDKVRKILERFYQGESSLEEERWLEEVFSSDSVPEELLPDKELFRTFAGEGKSVEIPDDLNRKILNVIDEQERKETRSRRISMFSLSGLAAGLLALVAIYLFILRDDKPAMLATHQWEDTYEDPMKAYEEAREALTFVSSKWNNGTSELVHVQNVSKKASDPLQSLSKINKGSRGLNLLGELQRVREIERQ